MSVGCGVVGTGSLGRGFVEALLRAGFAVGTYDVDPASADWASAAGAAPFASARELAAAAPVVVLAVPDTPDLERVVEGADGLAAGLARGAAVLITSTVDPATPLALAERLRPLGVDVLDTPVSGGPGRARAGTLTIMVGGAEAAVARQRAVLDALGEHVVHVGPLGHGMLAKLVNNLMGAVIALGVAEGLALAAKAELDLETTLDAIAHGSGSSWILREWVPETVLRGDYAPRFSVSLMCKDLRLVHELAARLGVPVPAGELARATFDELAGSGRGDADFAVLAAARAEAAGTSVGPAVRGA